MRSRLGLSVAAVALIAAVAACSSAGSSGSTASSGSSGSSGSGLTGKNWQLTGLTTVTPAFQGAVPEADQSKYTIEFKSDLTYSAKADCNMTSGTYTTTASGGITIAPGPTTLALCPEGSLSDKYIAALGKATSYAVASSQLTLTDADGGTLQFT